MSISIDEVKTASDEPVDSARELMSISIGDLKAAIRGGYHERQFALPLSSLKSPAIDALAADYFPSGTLNLINPQPAEETDDAITVRGTGSATPFTGMAVSVRFYVSGGDAACELSADGASGWALEQAFPLLAGTVVSGFVWTARAPRLCLSSQPDAGAKPSLAFEATLDLERCLGGFAGLLGRKEQALRGSFSVQEGGTSLRAVSIEAPVSEHVDLKIATVDQLAFRIGNHLYYDAFAKRFVAVPFIGLSAKIPFQAQNKPYAIPVDVEISDLGRSFRFQADVTQGIDAGLHELSSLAQDVGLDGFVPEDFHLEDVLRVNALSFDFNPTAATKLSAVSVGVESTRPWQILHLDASGKDLAVENIKFTFVVGFASNSHSVFTSLSGDIVIGSEGCLQVGARYPNFEVSGQLKEGSRLGLREVIADFAGPCPNVPALYFLNLSFHLGSGSYGLAGEVEGEWILGPLTLLALCFAVSHDSSGNKASVAGLLSIAGVTVLLSADYGGADAGWTFEGETESAIPLGKLIAELLATFSPSVGQQLPSILTSLTIKQLAVSYASKTEAFNFKCELDFVVDGREVDLTFHIDLEKSGGKYTQHYSATLQVGELRFALEFEKIKQAGEGTQQAEQTFFLAALQPAVKVGLRDLVSDINAESGRLMPDIRLDIEELLFAYQKSGDPAGYLFGAALGLDIDLATLPLVGKVFAGDMKTGVKDVQILFASQPVVQERIEVFNGLLTDAGVSPLLPVATSSDPNKPVQPTSVALDKGFNLSFELSIAGQTQRLGTTGAHAQVDTPPAQQPTPTQPPAGNASWFDVNKALGPVTLRRVGARYQDARIWLLLDADFRLSLLNFGLQGLGLGVDPRDPTSIRGDLAGMSLEYKSGPVEIAGGFLNFSGDFLGEALVKAGPYSFTAIGGLAAAENSFFIFIRLDAPLGGPPYFFVTGLAGGLGINRSLDIPKIDDLTSFALLPQNNDFPTTLDASSPGQTLAVTLAKTRQYIHPEAGEYWLAAGIDFTSFEMVDVSALLTVAFGVQLEVALLGICRITIPKLDPEPVAFLEVALEARFEPAAGLIAVDGRITPASFLFAGLVRISGGFAFYLWFDGEHAGDFVVTLGGYHPHFEKPAHYPTVPRLQLGFQQGPLTLKGESYLALLPHTLMAGLDVRLTFAEGPVSAWLDAGLNFLLGWRPFHYEAEAHIEVGASLNVDLLLVRVRITVYVGAQLMVWGPAFGGKARVDLDIFSFTIYFGADARKEVVSWEEFKQSFLPSAKTAKVAALALNAAAPAAADAHLCTAAVPQGLLQQPKAKDETAFFSWLLDPNHFEIATTTLIPAKQAGFNAFMLNNPFVPDKAFSYQGTGQPTASPDPGIDTPEGVAWPTDFGVLPVGINGSFGSDHRVSLCRLVSGDDYTDPAKYTDRVDRLRVTPILANAHQALWGASDPGLNGKRLIDGTLSGLRLSPLIQRPEITLAADLWSMLFDQNQSLHCNEVAPQVPTADSFAAKAEDGHLRFMRGAEPVPLSDYLLGDALTADSVAATRAELVGSLATLGLEVAPAGIAVGNLASYPFWDWPMVELLGEERA